MIKLLKRKAHLKFIEAEQPCFIGYFLSDWSNRIESLPRFITMINETRIKFALMDSCNTRTIINSRHAKGKAGEKLMIFRDKMHYDYLVGLSLILK